MKTGLGLLKKYRTFISYVNLLRFTLRKSFISFETANLFLQRVDKESVKLILKKNKAFIGDNSDIESGSTFHNCKNYENLRISNNCHIGKNCFFDLRDEIIIDDNVVVSMKCTFITHLDMSKSDLSKIYTSKNSKIVIKKNAYIGVNSTVLMGVTIGANSLVGAHSLVKDDVAQGSLTAGNPAVLIKQIQ